MLKFMIGLIVCSCLLFLGSCSSRLLMPFAAKDLASCKILCESRAKKCTKVCHNNCRECGGAAGQTAARKYKRYLNEQCIKGEIIALQLNSFRDPLQCRKVTCNCQADYQVCMQACGGKIQNHLQIRPLCRERSKD